MVWGRKVLTWFSRALEYAWVISVITNHSPFDHTCVVASADLNKRRFAKPQKAIKTLLSLCTSNVGGQRLAALRDGGPSLTLFQFCTCHVPNCVCTLFFFTCTAILKGKFIVLTSQMKRFRFRGQTWNLNTNLWGSSASLVTTSHTGWLLLR